MKHSKLSLLTYVALLGLVFFSACDGTEEPPVNPNKDPETLACNYFDEGVNRVLTDDPDKDIDYIVECFMEVETDLTIEAGVVIEFKTGAGLHIKNGGSISATGSSNERIILTGVDKIAGSWIGVLVETNDVKNEFDYVTISYGGSEATSNGNKANLIVWADSRASIDNCIISNSSNHGIEMAYNETVISSFNNNTLKNNFKPLYVLADNVSFLNATNDFTGNTNDYIEVGCKTLKEGSYAWKNLNVNYRVLSTDFGIFREIRVPDNCDLTIEAGTQIDFDTNTGIRVDDGGSLKAIGTETEKIIFSGVDGAAGAWKGLAFWFTQSVLNKLEYCVIEYAGGGDNDAAIYMWDDPVLEVNSCHIKDIDGCIFVDQPLHDPNGNFQNANFSESGNTFENISGGTFCP